MKYETKQRTHDWIAWVSGHPEMWEAGKTEDEAIEKLYISRAGSGKKGGDYGKKENLTTIESKESRRTQ